MSVVTSTVLQLIFLIPLFATGAVAVLSVRGMLEIAPAGLIFVSAFLFPIAFHAIVAWSCRGSVALAHPPLAIRYLRQGARLAGSVLAFFHHGAFVMPGELVLPVLWFYWLVLGHPLDYSLRRVREYGPGGGAMFVRSIGLDDLSQSYLLSVPLGIVLQASGLPFWWATVSSSVAVVLRLLIRRPIENVYLGDAFGILSLVSMTQVLPIPVGSGVSSWNGVGAAVCMVGWIFFGSVSRSRSVLTDARGFVSGGYS